MIVIQILKLLVVKLTQHSQFFEKIDHVGGAGVVAKHVAASGNKANLITVLGNDELKKFAINDLKSKVNYNGFTDKLRPTINKNAIVADNYRLIKISKLDNSPIKDEISSGICNKLSKSKADGVIFLISEVEYLIKN